MHGVKQNQPSQEFVTRVKLVALGALEGSRQVTVVTDGRGLLLSHRCEAVCSPGIQDKGSRNLPEAKESLPPQPAADPAGEPTALSLCSKHTK